MRSGEWEGLRSPKNAKRMIRSLKKEGFTLKEIARRMGVTAIRIKPLMQAGTERRIEAFYNYYVKDVA